MEEKNKLDYKKEYKDLYMPKNKPSLIEVPEMNFIMVRGHGNPNDENGEYSRALSALYALSFTIKMSKMSGSQPEGYFEYVVPPLEGLWWQEGTAGMDYSRKEDMQWYSIIRQPEFVTKEVFDWAVEECAKKKPDVDVSKAEYITYTEGRCVQMMHLGPYDDEPATLARLEEYLEAEGLKADYDSVSCDGITRKHHEIYLSDPRRTKPEKLKTVLRLPAARN